VSPFCNDGKEPLKYLVSALPSLFLTRDILDSIVAGVYSFLLALPLHSVLLTVFDEKYIKCNSLCLPI
jgi:hypothetical protein